MSENLSELLGRKGLNENLFDELGRRAKPMGSPENEDLEALAEKFLVGTANTFGTASFYDFLKPENKGKSVYVCNGTACLCAGTQNTVVDSLKDHFADTEIGHMTCLGRCHENSAFHYHGKNYSGSAVNDLERIIDSDSNLNNDKYTIGNNGKAILTADFNSIDDYYKPFLEALQKDREEVLDEIKTSNLRGRGGAGFPMGLKLEFCKNEDSEVKFIICNADEGDPGAYSDRYLL